MTPLAHHGYGEELLLALLASGGTTATAVLVVTRAKLGRLARWRRRR